MELALEHPSRASALILVGVPPEFDVPPERMDLMRHHAAAARTDRRWLPWSAATAPEVRAAYLSAGPAATPSVVLADLEARPLAAKERSAPLATRYPSHPSL